RRGFKLGGESEPDLGLFRPLGARRLFGAGGGARSPGCGCPPGRTAARRRHHDPSLRGGRGNRGDGDPSLARRRPELPASRDPGDARGNTGAALAGAPPPPPAPPACPARPPPRPPPGPPPRAPGIPRPPAR